MKKSRNLDKMVLVTITIILSILIAIASFSGIFIEATYSRNTIYFAAQGIGQDLINLMFVVPILLWTSYLIYKEKQYGFFIWSGAIFYVIYSYVIYSFAQPFNFLFIIYCMIFGLSFYAFLYYMFVQISKARPKLDTSIYLRSLIIFFVIISILFYFVWLSELIPSILDNNIPQSVIDNGTLTNPVHVLDLAIFLPALLIIALLLWKRNVYGYFFAPTLLIFMAFMSLAVIGMVIAMLLLGLGIDFVMTILFSAIFILSIIFTYQYFKYLT